MLIGAGVLVVVVLSLPIVNLVVGLPGPDILGPIDAARAPHRVAIAALGSKCGNCHTTRGVVPFYASFPVARSMVARDIEHGTRYLNLEAALAKWPVGEVPLAKIEHSVVHKTMPPHAYLMMHWNGGLSGEERDAVLKLVTTLRAEHYAAGDLPDRLRKAVVRPLPPGPKVDAEKVALGDRLYHDVRLSKDNSISCASCHDLAKGGTDRAKVSTGVGGLKGGINSPTVYNAVFNAVQFWDGRAADLQAQAGGPPLNPIEMASSWEEIIGKLAADEAFKTAFEKAYPKGLSEETITHAIAEFEKTLVTPGSAFDRYLGGEEGALGADAKAGHELFMARGCATCHVGHAMGGQSFEQMGRDGDYFGDRGGSSEADLGRYNVTKKEEDRHRFKVPLLRNVALTAPYFHDGSVSDLGDAAQKMAVYMLGKGLSKPEQQRIAAFLESLTGTYQGKPLR